jgi:hypothetical protein
MGMKHSYKSLKADPADSTIIGATKWNDDHYFLDASGAAIGAVGDLAYRGASGIVALITGAQGLLYSAGSGNVPAYTMTPTVTTLTATTIVVGGNTISGTELGFVDGVTAGTAAASKAVVLDANKDIGTIRHLTLSGNLVSGSTTIDETDLQKIDGQTAGTVSASKAVVVDANKDITGFRHLSMTGALVTTSTGPHAIGGATSSAAQLFIRGTFAERTGVEIGMAVTPGAGVSGQLLNIAGSFIEAGSGTHALLASARIAIGSVSAGAATVMDTASVYIEGPMVATVSGANYALWVDAGIARFDGLVTFGGVAVTEPALKANGNQLDVRVADDSDASGMGAKYFLASESLRVGTNYATTGEIRLHAGGRAYARNAANSANYGLIGGSILSNNDVFVGDTANVTALTLAAPIVTFTGQSSSFPALKRNSAGLDVKLADDSNYTTVRMSALGVGAAPGSAGQIVATGKIATDNDVQVAAGQGFLIASRAYLYSPGSAQLNLFNSGATIGVGFDFATDGILKLRDRAMTAGAVLDFLEQTAPTGASNAARIYAEDNGSGKTRLMVIFGSGVAQQIAIEP